MIIKSKKPFKLESWVINVNLTPTHIKIAEQLLNKIENEKDNIKITYGELSKRLGGKPIPLGLNRFLGDLSTLCKDNDMPLISAIVVNKQSRVAGDGFMQFFFEHLRTEQEKEEQYIKCLNEVKNYNKWNSLRSLLESL